MRNAAGRGSSAMNADLCFHLWGTALNGKKRIACFYLGTAVNIAWVFVDCRQGLWARSVRDVVHLVFAVWGIWDWTRRPPR